MLDHQVLLLDTTVAVTRGILPSQRAPTVAGGIALDRDLLLDTPVAVVLLPVSYFRFPNSRTHCERISERIANACSITKCCCWIPRWPSLVGSSQANELPRWPVASHDRSPSAAAAGYPGGRHSWDPPRPSSSHGGRWHRELDHQVLLDTMVAVTRGMLISWVPGIDVSTANPNGNSSDPRETFLLDAWFADSIECAHIVPLKSHIYTRAPCRR